MIEICLKDDNMHIFVMINALICINNYVITCINKFWFKTDKVVLAIINSSLTESTMPIVVGKETNKDVWNAIIRNFS